MLCIALLITLFISFGAALPAGLTVARQTPCRLIARATAGTITAPADQLAKQAQCHRQGQQRPQAQLATQGITLGIRLTLLT